MSVENHIIKDSFCGTFQKAVKLKRSITSILLISYVSLFTSILLITFI